MLDKTKKDYFRIKRYYTYIAITITILVIPFIKINSNQIFLLSFDKKQLHLMGTVFDMQELYMMPFLLMLLFLGIFAITAIGGRAWCGWACPQTIFRVIYRDLIQSKLLNLRRIKNKQKEPDMSKFYNKIKYIISIILWTFLSLLAAANFMWYFVSPDDFFTYIFDPFNHTILFGFVLSITVFLVYDVVFLQENFCVYICPYSRVQSVLYDDDTIQAIYHQNRGGKIYNKNKEKVIFKQKDFEKNHECTACQSCVTVCPTHIDIRKGAQLECINCLECVDACTNVMGKLGKKSLIQWSSTNEVFNNKKTNVFRKKTLMYLFVLVVVVLMLFVMGAKKENMLLNINKTTFLYKIKDKGTKVENNFLFLFQNTQNKNYTYDLEIVGKYKNKIKIERFKAFKLSANKLRKKVIKLSTRELLVDNPNKDTALSIKIRAFAIENEKEISIYRNTVFMFPKSDKLNIK